MRLLFALLFLSIGLTASAQKDKVPGKGYDKIYPYNKRGWAKVEKAGKVGYIDRTGNEVIECIYDDIYPFEKGQAKVIKNGKFGLVRESGEIFVDPKYDYIGPFINGLAVISVGTRRGLLNEQGEEIVEVE
jgi:hypothetical protein